MRIEKDKNNLLTIFNEEIPQTKEYAYHVSGYTFSDFDRWIIVLHKKEWKIINLKNLGDNMNVVYMKNSEFRIQNLELKKTGINKAMKTFQWFDEESGKKYYFIPGLGEIQRQEKNIIFKNLWTNYSIEKTTKGMILQGIEETEGETDILGYLFGLMLIYGKWEAKSKELNSIKIQIPLSGQHLVHEEDFDIIIKILQDKGIFLKADKLPNKNGITYQISSNDYELLEIFAQWYEAVEKFEKISKRVFTEEMKTKLIEFINTNAEIPQEGKAEVVKQLEEWTIKLLTK
ncbi:MAG: hypothetical protein ACD_80C00058G0006 [uncultured bacterium (gcode 4)]|uniref:Uncharacterized protein n=1 Tax=uncultured bacterium (gcode 4) TaxID=1234023 RepID=K1XJM9_9BACT|nr:MAG: hypothetical protein ACD_80C00058G0006 [uncultured bacterium (gcode 4)]